MERTMIGKITNKFLRKILAIGMSMLKNDKKDYIELDSRRQGDLKIERGMRIRFLDEMEKDRQQ